MKFQRSEVQENIKTWNSSAQKCKKTWKPEIQKRPKTRKHKHMKYKSAQIQENLNHENTTDQKQETTRARTHHRSTYMEAWDPNNAEGARHAPGAISQVYAAMQPPNTPYEHPGAISQVDAAMQPPNTPYEQPRNFDNDITTDNQSP